MYFNHCADQSQAAQLFKELAKIHHPVKGGVLAIYQAIEAEYKALNFEPIKQDPQPEPLPVIKGLSTAKEIDTETLNAAAAAKMFNGVKVEIVGTWVWVTGDTRPVKDQLQAIGFKWAKKRTDMSAYFFRTEANKVFKRRGQKMELDQIKDKYGVKELF